MPRLTQPSSALTFSNTAEKEKRDVSACVRVNVSGGACHWHAFFPLSMHAPLGKTETLKHLAAAVGWRWHNLGVTREKHVHTTLALEPKHTSQRLQCEPWRNGQPFPRGQRWRLLAEARPQPSTCKERHTRKGPTGRGMSPERYLAYPHAKRISPPRIEKNAFWLLPMWAGHKLELSKTAMAKQRH